MHFSALPTTILLSLALLGGANAAASDDKKTKPVEPCTVASPLGAFYDLRSLSILPPKDDKKVAKGVKTDDWHARGYDYHDNKVNFTLNICAPLVDPIRDPVGVDKDVWQNVSAYYAIGSKKFSIGLVETVQS